MTKTMKSVKFARFSRHKKKLSKAQGEYTPTSLFDQFPEAMECSYCRRVKEAREEALESLAGDPFVCDDCVMDEITYHYDYHPVDIEDDYLTLQPSY